MWIPEGQARAGSDGLLIATGREVLEASYTLPLFSEQYHIVTEVERWLPVVAELEATVATYLARAKRLR